ncbi:MAG TPA: RNHCP domain-containing protein [Anaerolineales bacterium]|nr:RNHCP domain-containing protein [Anaerolineales bacterium]
MKGRRDPNPDFRCVHCSALVPAQSSLAGVNHRNHCPYCLWSRHLDLRAAGDRLSACKAPMKPVGLTMKRRNKKYPGAVGELMVMHHCTGCGTLSINRIAADDLSEVLLEVLAASAGLSADIREQALRSGIDLLGPDDLQIVQRQLFGDRSGS